MAPNIIKKFNGTILLFVVNNKDVKKPMYDCYCNGTYLCRMERGSVLTFSDQFENLLKLYRK
jgi:hypothetical protein